MLKVEVFTFNPVEENTYLVINDNKESLVLDPGCYFDYERSLLKDFISNNGLDLKYLLNTHCHLDHVFGNKFIHETYGLPLYLHKEEKIVLEYAPTSALRWNLPFEGYKGPLHFLEEGDTVSLGEDKLKVLFIPGHSPGHIVFYCEKQGFIIGGDVLFRGSIGRTDLLLGDFDTLIESIRSRLLVLPDEVIVYPGHGAQTTIGYERKHNPFLK